MKAEPRRTPPMSIKLKRALEQFGDAWKTLGLIPVDVTPEFDFDHDPALGLRDVDPATGRHIPHQHEPSCLIWRPKKRHEAKTRGTGATTAGSDVGEMRKTRQLVRARVKRGEIAPDDPSIAPWAPDQDRREKPKRPIQGRGLSGRKADKLSPCRQPSKLAGLPRNTFTERSR